MYNYKIMKHQLKIVVLVSAMNELCVPLVNGEEMLS
jgi:hypothetical protein